MAKSQFVVWGMSLLLGGCSLDIISPEMVILSRIMPVLEALRPSVINFSSGSSAATPISSDNPPNAKSFSGKDKNPSISDKSQEPLSSAQDQNSPILVPMIPDKDNGQVIVTYKSKIEETQTLIRTINESQLTKEQHETFISIHSFLNKAQEAFVQNDMSMAVNLAEKAHTLTREIVKNSTQP
jgi:hypothetical protein